MRKEAYFDSMTHFDFKCLLPALLQVEDRMSMAHGLEGARAAARSFVVEFAATIPADIKFKGGQMKHFLKSTFADDLPRELMERRDKMGFPVPFKEWFSGELGISSATSSRRRGTAGGEFFNSNAILANLREGRALLAQDLGPDEPRALAPGCSMTAPPTIVA